MVVDRFLGPQRALGIGASLMALGLSLLASIHAIPYLVGAVAHVDVQAAIIRAQIAIADMTQGSGVASAVDGGGAINLACSVMSVMFYAGLGLLAVGNALYNPILSALLGQLPHGTVRAIGAAFGTFFVCIAVGAVLGAVGGGVIAERFGWYWAICAATAGMLVAVELISTVARTYVALSQRTHQIRVTAQPSIRAPANNNAAILIALMVAILYTASNNQIVGSVEVFSQSHVDRRIGTFMVPPSWFAGLDPLLIVVVTPFINKWRRSAGVHSFRLGTASSFSVGLIFLGFAFILLVCAAFQAVGAAALASPWWVAAACSLAAGGDIFIAPLTYSAISKLRPLHWKTVGQGALSAAFGVGAWCSGRIGAATVERGPIAIFSAVGAGIFLGVTLLWINRRRLSPAETAATDD